MGEYEASWPRVVSVAQVVRELRRHGLELWELEADLGVCESYRSVDVLVWLGY